MRTRQDGRELGQAGVESALVLPMFTFMVLGTLQLFMMLQARIVTQYAAYQAVRVGSLNKGDCAAMLQAATLAVLPTVTNTENSTELAKAYAEHLDGFTSPSVPIYRDAIDGFRQPMVQISRERPLQSQIRGTNKEDIDFDDPYANNGNPYELEIHMVYWYNMRIPFAREVMSLMFLARYGIQPGPKWNLYQFTSKATGAHTWDYGKDLGDLGGYGGKSLPTRMMEARATRHYIFPIQVSAVMPMMTPPNKALFANKNCPSPN